MKSSKFWNTSTFIVLILGIVISFFSCSKSSDDSDTENDSVVVGSWTGTVLYSSGYEKTNLIFNSNGTGLYTKTEVSSYGKDSGTAPFTYQLTSETEGIIIVKEQSSSHPGGFDIDTYQFVINGKTMLLYEVSEYHGIELECTLYKD